MEHLQRNLRAWHIRSLALGSVIGTGLFYGSASVIRLAGPAVILTHIIGDVVVYMIIHALGEMAMRQPVSDSFGRCTRDNLGPLADPFTDWTYVLEVVTVCLAGMAAFGIYMGFWFPEVSQWAWMLGIVMPIRGLNLCNVKVFSKMESQPMLIKIAAIDAMIIDGTAILSLSVKMNGEYASDLSNLRSHGGFLPHDAGSLMTSFAMVMFTYGGIEITDITGGEAQDPDRVIPKAISVMPARTLLLYVLTMYVLMAIFPWTGIGGQGSPFVQIFSGSGIQSAVAILNLIVTPTAISAINSNIFSASRMMYGMAEQGRASRIFTATSHHGVFWVAVLFMASALLYGVVLNYLIPENVSMIIASIATFATVWVWLMILLSQVAMRRRLSVEKIRALKFKVPLWPVGPVLIIMFMLFVVGILGVMEDARVAFYVGADWMLFMPAVWYLRAKPSAAVVLAEEVSGV